MEELLVVAFERRGRIGWGALKGGGEKNARLIDDEGETIKIGLDKVLHRFKARVQDGDARAVKERLRALASSLASKAAVDLDLLWSSLEDDAVYTLEHLARTWFDDANDAAVAAIVRALSPDAEDEDAIPYFRARSGGLVRTDEPTLSKIKARVEAERRRREEEARFREWFQHALRQSPATKPLATPPPEHDELLGALREWALMGERSPQAARARRLGRDLGLETEDDALLTLERMAGLPRDVNELPLRAGVPVAFGHRARGELDALVAAPEASFEAARRDFRGKLTTAIDDATTQDVDDAFSLWRESDRWLLAIHIADVAAVVPSGGELDLEARRRATSIYFPGDTVPMLPWPLTRGRLSLDAGVDRRVVSLVVRVKDDGTLDGPVELVRGIARVDRRLTYEQSLELPDEWREPFPLLEKLAANLKRARLDRGALSLELPDVKIAIDEQGEPHVSLRRPDTPGHLVVSELMVLYNHAVARRLAEARAAALYRAQPEAVSITIPADDPLFALRARRGLAPTLVEVDPGPHRTIGLDVYLQASSPIRRYGDLIAQRQLAAILAGCAPSYSREEVLALKQDVERAERAARRIESDRELYWVCRWLETKRQETFEGVVSRAPEHGRGLVWIPAIGLELALGDPDDEAKVAEGEKVRVRVRRASPRRRSVSFEVVRDAPAI